MTLFQFGDTYAFFQGETDEGEVVEVWVEDHGQPGADPGDYINIYYMGQTWEG